MRLSLRLLLACGLGGLQFVAVLAVVFSSYFSSERALITHARDLLRDVGVNAIEHSKGFLDPARGAAELAARLAQNEVVASDDQARLEQLLFQQLQIAPQFAGLYYGGEDGSFVYVMRSTDKAGPFRTKLISYVNGQRFVRLIWRGDDFSIKATEVLPQDRYDPRERTWYKGARDGRRTIWSDPYIFYSSQQPGITLAAPVLKGRRGVKGVVGVDIEISKISDFLSKLKIGVTGKAMVIHRNGDVIAHPDMDLIRISRDDGTLRFATIAEFGDPIARAAFGSGGAAQGAVGRSETHAQFTWGGKIYVSTVLPPISERLPWTIAVYAPEDDFTSGIKANRQDNIRVAALVALITGLIGLVLADYIHRPLRAFATRSRQMSSGEISPAAPAPRTYPELERADSTLMQQIAARREVEREYGQTFEMSSRAMAQISCEDGSVIRANARFAELLLAPSAADLVGRRISDVAHPDDMARYALAGGAARGADPGADPLRDPGHGESNIEMRWRRRDGSWRHVSLNSIVIRDEQGLPLHGVLMVDDISDYKAREAEIARLNRDLSHLARGNTMGEMASGLAHELNQPLTVIAQNTGTALLTLEQREGDDAEMAELLTEIERESLRAGDIIRALRGFIRKDEGDQVPFDLSLLLDQTLTLVHAEAVEANVRILDQLPEDLPAVIANRVQVAQVLVNLLRNAIEAISTAPQAQGRVTVAAQRDGTRLQVSVEDDGPGVSEAITLFSQFETTKKDGMGLGLSICRSILEANGGVLWHERRALQGAKFCFTLPLAPAAKTAPALAPEAKARGAGAVAGGPAAAAQPPEMPAKPVDKGADHA